MEAFVILWMHFGVEIVLLLSICYVLMFYLFNNYFKYEAIDIVCICIFFVILMLYISLTEQVIDGLHYVLNNYFIYSEFYNLIKRFMLLCMLIFFILLNNFNYIIKLPIFEYLILTLTCLLGLFVIIRSNHLFIIFLFLELVNLCIYCLISLNKNSNMGIECAYKYFVQSSFATIIGFFGVSLIYMSAGTLFLNELNILISYDNLSWLTVLGIYFIISSVFFKLGVFPLHSWIPDVYQGALLISVIFIAILPKIAYVVLFLKLFIEFHSIINNYCLLLSGISVIYGSFISLYQTSFKRLLAYGSMVHMGLIIFSICLFTIQAITAALFYLYSYIILMLFTFSFMFFLFEKNDSGLYYVDDISQFNFILSKNTLLSIFFSLILFALAGLPLFIGFIAKWYIFLSLVDTHNLFELMIFLSISVLSASYYIRLIRFIFFIDNKNKKVKVFSNLYFDKAFYNLIFLLFFINIITIILHNTIFLFIFKHVLILFL